jgi:threonine/homoserine/homoserine lactone efflux protein
MLKTPLEFALTALLIELTPGPNMAWLAALALAEGRRKGFAAVAGVTLGLAGIGLLSVFGLATIINEIPHAYDILRYAGALFLLFLAWEGWRGGETGEPMSDGAAFRRALMTNLLNPKAALFYIAVLPMFLVPSAGSLMAQSLFLLAIYVAVATVIHAGIVAFAAALRPYIVKGPYEIVVRRALALMLALVALWFFMGTRR